LQTDPNEHDSSPTLDTKLISRLTNRWVAAFNAHDVESIVELYAENAELFDSGMRYPRKGRHQIRSWFVQRFRQMPTIQYTPIEYFFNETEGTIHWLARGHTPPILGQRWLVRPFEVDGVSIFHMDDGLITWQHGYYDHLQTLEKVLPLLRWLPLKL
jgi:uncharacterized protein (TIGR02246 family)